MPLKIKTVLITGASRGLGLAMVHQYWSDGWKVIACHRNRNNYVDKERLVNVPLDVRDSKQIENLSIQLENESIDVLINNAGINGPSDQEVDLFGSNEWKETFQVNTIGPYMMARAFLNQVERSQSKMIANISSIYGSIQLNNRGDYCFHRASKAALNAVTKCLAVDLQEKGISVLSLHPGSVRTDMNPEGKISPSESAQGIKKILDSVSLKDSGSFLNYKHESVPW